MYFVGVEFHDILGRNRAKIKANIRHIHPQHMLLAWIEINSVKGGTKDHGTQIFMEDEAGVLKKWYSLGSNI